MKAVSAVLLLAALLLQPLTPALAAEPKHEPSIDKTSILIKTVKQLFWAGNDRQVWKWTPSIEFRVNGPLAAGTKLYADYSIEGKPWVSYQCEDIRELSDGGYWNTYGGRAADPLRDKASTHTGTVSFSIRAKNPLEGTDKTLYTGKFTVKRYPYPSSKAPQYKEAYTYYVDYDWALPIGLLTFAKSEMNVDWETPLQSPLLFYMWFKGDEHKHRPPEAYLYFNGRKIGDTTGDGACWEKLSSTPWEASEESYHFYQFIFSKVLAGLKPGAEVTADVFKTWENPGEYEVRVLWDGKLVRTAKWTLSGGVSDGGVSPQLNARSFQPEPSQWTDWVRVIPVTIKDNLGIPYDKATWQTEAYFGNPLKGFTVP